MGHAFNIFHEVKSSKTPRSVMDGVVSTALLLVLESLRYSKDMELSSHTPFSSRYIWLSTLLLIIFLSIPRGNSEFHHGSPIDRQNTASLLELVTFLWPRKVFQLDFLGRQDVASLPALPSNLRAATLAEHHRHLASKLESSKLVLVLVTEYIRPILFQCFLAVSSALASLGPNIVTYQLLQHLSSEGVVGNNRDTLFLAALLGLSKALPVFLSAWVNWVGSSMIYLPMRTTLSALIYQKILSLPAVALSADDKQSPSKGTWLQVGALRFACVYPIM